MDQTHMDQKQPRQDHMESLRHPAQPMFGNAWGWVLAYACVMVALAIAAFLHPFAASIATGLLLGLLLLFYGAAAIASGLSTLSQRARWIEVILGVVALVAGLLTLFNPFVGALSLLWVFGAWLLVAGVLELVSAARGGHDRGWRLLLGAVDIALGAILLFSTPAVAIILLATLIGVRFLIRGTFLVALAFTLRKLKRG